MLKKTKSKHSVCFIYKTSKTLKVKILSTVSSGKNIEKIAEINKAVAILPLEAK